MSTAILDLDRTQLLEKNKPIKTDSQSIPSLIPGISNETNTPIDNKFETIGEEAFFGNTSGLITSDSDEFITAAIPDIPVTFDLSTGYTTDPLFGNDLTLIRSRINPQEPLVSGTYTIRGRLRNVQNVTVDPSQFVDVNNFTPNVTLRGSISPALFGTREFNPAQSFAGIFNVFEVTGGSGSGLTTTGQPASLTFIPQTVVLSNNAPI